MMASPMEGLYREVILDHYRNPHGSGLVEPFDVEVTHVNPSCGDEITLRLSLAGKTPELAVSYAATGCSISQASASVMHDLVDSGDVAGWQERFDAFHHLVTDIGTEVDEETEELLEDGVAFGGVAQFPMRVKCALLPWMALRDALVRVGGITEEER